MKITLIAHKYSLKVKMLYITRHCLIFFCIQGLIRVLIYVTLSPKQTLFQWALYKGISSDFGEGGRKVVSLQVKRRVARRKTK